MGNAMEKAVSKAATEAGLLEIESAEINFDSDINLNLDSSAIGIVVAVICGVIIVIIIVVSLCSRYCCNCCDNLCFQGRGQNRKGEKTILKSDVTSPETPIYPIFNGTIDPSRGCVSCGSQGGNGTLAPSHFGGTINRAPSMAPSYFAQTLGRDDIKFDGIVIPMNKSSEYHTLADQEKNEILNTQAYPTIQYCTMANGEVGMYLPKNTEMLDILNRRNQCSTMKQKSHYAEPYHCHTISRSTTTRHEISRNRPMAIDYHDEVDRSKSMRNESPSKRRRRKSKQSSRSHRSTSDKGYKSDSSQFRSKSQATNQTTTSPLSSLSDTPEEIENIRPEIDGRRKRNRKERESRLSRISNSEPPLYKVKTRIGEHNFESVNTIK